MIAIVVAAALTVPVAGTAGPNILVAVDGASIESATCRIVNDADPAASTRLRKTPTALEWSCVVGDRLQCDAPSMEPIDLDANACSATHARIRFQKADLFSLDISGPATIEWRSETPKGTRLIATRPISGAARLPVALGGRVIRVHRHQRSPISTYVTPNIRVRLDNTRGGGEIFGRITRKTINPIRVLVDGPFQTEVPIDSSGRFSVTGLPAGEYQVSPVYSGDIKRAAKPLTVENAKTSEMFALVSETVGGVLLGVAPQVCEPTHNIALTRMESQARSATFQTTFRRSLAHGCDWQLEGLAPGRYHATVTTPDFGDLKAVEDFVIESDRLAFANVGEPPVVVEGRVMLGEKPGDNLLIAFERTNSSGRLWLTTTNHDGSYRLALDSAGSYAVAVRAARRLGAESQLARLHNGLNRFDLTLSETRLRVKLERADRRPLDEVVQVHIDGLGRDRSGFVVPGEGNTLNFAGIPYGNFVITADTNSGLSALQPGAASISKASPEADVVLVLGSGMGELRLVADDRSPVQAARVQVNARLLDQVAPGVFELKSVSPGSRALISAPGFIPMCHVLTSQDFPQATLVMGRGTHAVELHFTPPVSGPIGEFEGLPGSTCPVPLGITSFGATEDAKSTTIRVSGFPEGRFTYRPTMVTPPEPVDVPGPMVKFTKPKPQF